MKVYTFELTFGCAFSRFDVEAETEDEAKVIYANILIGWNRLKMNEDDMAKPMGKELINHESHTNSTHPSTT